MTDTVITILWIFMTSLVGWGTLSIMLHKNRSLYCVEKIALSFPMGLGLISIEMAILPVFGIRFSPMFILAWWAPIILAGLVLTAKRMVAGTCVERIKKNKFSLLEKFLLIGISFEVSYAFFRALIKPIESYDAIAIYALKAKIFYLAQTIPANFFTFFKDFVPHIEYPLALPLAETYFYVFMGNLNDILVKVMFPIYYAAILALLYGMVRRSLDRKIALLFTFLLATIPQFKDYATNGYSDILLTFYYSASFFYLLLWMEKKETALLALSFIFSILCIWTKTEGLMLTVINIMLIFVHIAQDRSHLKEGAIFIFLSAISIIGFLYMKMAFGLGIHSDFAKVDYSHPMQLISNIKRIPIILYEYQIQFFGPKKWNIVWVLFILGLIANFKRIFSKELKFVTLAIMAVLVGYTFIYLITPQNVAWHISTTASRFFIHFLPAVMLWLALTFKAMKIKI